MQNRAEKETIRKEEQHKKQIHSNMGEIVFQNSSILK